MTNTNPKTEVITLPNMAPMESSNIHAIGHDAATNTLYVQFKAPGDKPGSIYRYKDVPPTDHKALIEAPSIGKHLNQHIKGRFVSEKV